MLTKDFLDVFLDGVAASVSRVRARVLTNNAQNQILGIDNSITEVQPAPYFATVAGQFSYQANGSFLSSRNETPGDPLDIDIRNVRRIYNNPQDGTNWPLWYRYPEFTRNVQEGLSFDCTESNAPGANDCRIDLNKNMDPGDTETIWISRLYRWPNQIVSDNTVLDIPEDFCLTLLYEAVKKMIERDQYGRADATQTPYDIAMAAFVAKYGNPVRQDTPRFTSRYRGY